MICSVFIIVAVLAVKSNAASLFDLQKDKSVQVFELNVGVDKTQVKNAVGEILIESYPFKFGIIRDEKQRLNGYVFLDEMFKVSDYEMTVKWESEVGLSGGKTSLIYNGQTLPASPYVSFNGQWSNDDVNKRNGELRVNLTDSQGIVRIQTLATINAAQQTTAGVTVALGPITLTLQKDTANKVEDSVDLILPTLQTGNHIVESAVGFSQNTERQTEFYIAASSGLFKGKVNIDTSVNVDVMGGVTLYNYENDGIQFQVEHYHTDQNEILGKFAIGPVAGTIHINKFKNREASFVIDFQFVKINMDIGKDGRPLYQATAELDPLSFSIKATENGIDEVSVKVLGRNEYSLLLKTDLANRYNLDLVVYGQPFSIQL